jgi:hypothetical protein
MRGRITTTLALLNFRVGLTTPEMLADLPGIMVYTFDGYAVHVGESEHLRSGYEVDRESGWNRPDLTFHWLVLDDIVARQNLVRHLVGQFNPPGNVAYRSGPIPDALTPIYGRLTEGRAVFGVSA